MCLFDVLGMRLNNQLSLWCIQEQLGQITLILPLTLIVFELHYYVVRNYLFYSENISEPVLYYFCCIYTWVKNECSLVGVWICQIVIKARHNLYNWCRDYLHHPLSPGRVSVLGLCANALDHNRLKIGPKSKWSIWIHPVVCHLS